MDLSIALRLGYYPGNIVAGGVPKVKYRYFRPDGTSLYNRPDGVSIYFRP